MNKKTKTKPETIWSKLSYLIVFLYLWFVLWGQYSLLDTVFPPLPIAVGIIILAAVLARLLLRWCSTWRLKLDAEKPEKKDIKKLALLVFGISFGILLISYYSRFPGIYFMDSVNSLNQYMTNSYGNWHPVLYTLLAFTIPMKLGGVWLIELLQIIFYCLVLTYMLCTLRYYRCPRFICICVFIYLMMQPDTTYILLFPMKDCAFAILTMLLVTEYVHIVCTKGEWLEKNINLICIIINLVVCTIVRHNAILFTAPLLLAVLFYSRKKLKRCLVLVLASALLFTAIKIPLYKCFNIQKNEYRVVETTGLCMVMMGNVYVDAPWLLSDEVKDFFDYLDDDNENCEYDTWEGFYKRGDWNLVKCLIDVDKFNVIEEYGGKKMLEMTIDTLFRAPDQSLKAFYDVTGMVWKLDGDKYWIYTMRTYDTNYVDSETFSDTTLDELEKYSVELPLATYIADVMVLYRDIIQDSFLKYAFCYIGMLNLLLLLTCLSKLKEGKDAQRILHILPVMAYSYGTALLLSGYDWRFFFYTYGCFFPIMFLMLKEETDGQEVIKTA